MTIGPPSRPDRNRAGVTGVNRIDLDGDGLPCGTRLRSEWEVTPRQVKALRDQGEDFVLIDCRTPWEHKIARIKGGVHVPMEEIGGRLVELQAFSERTVILYCHHGLRSLQVAQFLRREGFEDVKSMAGGIDLWSVAVDAAVPRY